jgi:hypothetical protein
MKKGLIYISVGLGVSAIAYLVISVIKSNKNKNDKDEDFVPEQEKPNTSVTKAIQDKTIVGKNVYSRVNDVKIRTSPQVNDGAANNIYGVVINTNTLIGKVVKVVEQPKTNNPNTKKAYNWLSINMDKALYDDIQSRRSWYDRDLFKAIPNTNRIWVREDIIKL